MMCEIRPKECYKPGNWLDRWMTMTVNRCRNIGHVPFDATNHVTWIISRSIGMTVYTHDLAPSSRISEITTIRPPPTFCQTRRAFIVYVPSRRILLCHVVLLFVQLEKTSIVLRKRSADPRFASGPATLVYPAQPACNNPFSRCRCCCYAIKLYLVHWPWTSRQDGICRWSQC